MGAVWNADPCWPRCLGLTLVHLLTVTSIVYGKSLLLSFVPDTVLCAGDTAINPAYELPDGNPNASRGDRPGQRRRLGQVPLLQAHACEHRLLAIVTYKLEKSLF